MNRTIIASFTLLALAACGSGDPAGKSTTKLDAVEVQPGSVSDSMIILDNAGNDGTAVDSSIPDDNPKKETAKSEEDNSNEMTADPEETENPDAVPIPAAKKAVTADSPAKKGE